MQKNEMDKIHFPICQKMEGLKFGEDSKFHFFCRFYDKYLFRSKYSSKTILRDFLPNKFNV